MIVTLRFTSKNRSIQIVNPLKYLTEDECNKILEKYTDELEKETIKLKYSEVFTFDESVLCIKLQKKYITNNIKQNKTESELSQDELDLIINDNTIDNQEHTFNNYNSIYKGYY